LRISCCLPALPLTPVILIDKQKGLGILKWRFLWKSPEYGSLFILKRKEVSSHVNKRKIEP
jgi:hypothetical protein